MSSLSYIDIVVIAAYFLILAAIAWWAAKREKNISSDFFLASRDVGWLAVGASLFASNIGSEHLVGLAGTGAASGLAVGHFEWLASFILLLLGWLFVPFYMRTRVFTMPEFLEKRFSVESRSCVIWVSITVGYVLTKISVTLFAGGIVMRAVTVRFLDQRGHPHRHHGPLHDFRWTAGGHLHGSDAGRRTDRRIGDVDVHRPACRGGMVRPESLSPARFLLHVEAIQSQGFPMDGRRLWCADPRHLVLVYRPAHRAASAYSCNIKEARRGRSSPAI
jgi:hypothetical protein